MRYAEGVKSTALTTKETTLDQVLDKLRDLDIFDVVIRPYPTELSTGHKEGRFLAFQFTGTFTHETIFGTLPINGWGKTALGAVQDLLEKRLVALATENAILEGDTLMALRDSS